MLRECVFSEISCDLMQYACMHVCMYMCVCVYALIWCKHSCMQTYMYQHDCGCMNVHVHAHLYTFKYTSLPFRNIWVRLGNTHERSHRSFARFHPGTATTTTVASCSWVDPPASFLPNRFSLLTHHHLLSLGFRIQIGSVTCWASM